MRKRALMFALAGLVGAVVAAPIAVYASHAFVDVPSSNTFHEDIAWMAQAGVTKGCNPPANTEYCPKDAVTREQMAAFMHRLADNRVVDAATAVEAESAQTVDGWTPNDLLRVASGWTEDPPNSDGEAVSTTITAPNDGFLIVSGAIDAALGVMGHDEYGCRLTVNGVTTPGTLLFSAVDNNGEVGQDNCVTTGVHPVEAGTHHVALTISARTTAVFTTASVWAMYVPFDGEGVQGSGPLEP